MNNIFPQHCQWWALRMNLAKKSNENKKDIMKNMFVMWKSILLYEEKDVNDWCLYIESENMTCKIIVKIYHTYVLK